MEDQSKRFTAHDAPKKILVAGPGGAVANPKQFVVTQSKGTTIIQPAAVVHGTSNTTQPQHQQYIVTGTSFHYLVCVPKSYWACQNSLVKV